MWTPVSRIEQDRNFGGFVQFAIENKEKYGICMSGNDPLVNTWHVDEMIKDFKNINYHHTQGLKTLQQTQ